ncbi:hypothetical protein [Clostridium aminobutyricum]|uniref:Uncharacterized protein n=1 Tax=Clostridium aminobutyricum TaxID=33953 RepID=A0A939D6L4_CLOAM|nr:hypothetical protein [Clostridium aminobutyricum]MBN7772187.1 hypothetical protein [Clostridium aminobutyricum]
MKKKICFYIGWDVLIILLLYAYYSVDLWIRQYRMRTFDIPSVIIVKPIFLMIIGAFLALLVWISSRYQFTRKLAVLEFILIGVPAFYLATIIEMSYLIYFLIGVNIPLYIPSFWLVAAPALSMIESIIFGYELFMFINRMVKLRYKSSIPDEKQLMDSEILIKN